MLPWGLPLFSDTASPSVRSGSPLLPRLQTWQEPWESVAAMAAIVVLCFAPRVAVPLVLAWVVAGTLAVQPEFEGARAWAPWAGCWRAAAEGCMPPPTTPACSSACAPCAPFAHTRPLLPACLPACPCLAAEGALRMEQDPPDIEPENESLETTTVNPLVNLRAKVDRLTRMGLLVQNVLDDVASAMERAGVRSGLCRGRDWGRGRSSG